MSGLLRRIKRAPAAGDQPPAEGTAAAATGAPSTAEPASGAAPAGGSVLPPQASGPPGLRRRRGLRAGHGRRDRGRCAGGPGAAAPAGPEPLRPAGPGHCDRRAEPLRPARPAPLRRRPGAAESPAGATDPELPAGVDPAEAAVQPPKGRRGRLRKRLRYLRRARELMLRDLGGVLYEVYRTGSGRVEAHAAIIGPKVSRLAALDSEAHALEAALGAAHGQAVMFEPGVGGACAVCGELYASGARFCSRCGTATKLVPAPDSAASDTGGPTPAAAPPLIASAPPEARTAELGAQGSPSLGLARAEPEPEQKPTDDAAAAGAEPTAAEPAEQDAQPERSPDQPRAGGDERPPARRPHAGRLARGARGAPVTGVETPPPPSTGRQCPRCGAALTDVQEWCLHCGAAVGTRVVAAPGWRTPIVVVGGLLALAAVAIAVALVQLADDTGDVTQDPAVAAATPTPAAAAPTPTPTPTLPEASGQETPTPTPDANATPTPTPATPGERRERRLVARRASPAGR